MSTMKPCGRCGKHKDPVQARCPHCGKVEWDLLAGLGFVSLFGLGGMAIVGEVDGPLYLAVIFGSPGRPHVSGKMRERYPDEGG